MRLTVKLSQRERQRYDALVETRNRFLQQRGILLGSLAGWQAFVSASARSEAGRGAMLAHREARAIAFGTPGKLRVLANLLAQHHPARTLIFTDDNAMVYRISREYLIPAITHQTPVKERHDDPATLPQRGIPGGGCLTCAQRGGGCAGSQHCHRPLRHRLTARVCAAAGPHLAPPRRKASGTV